MTLRWTDRRGQVLPLTVLFLGVLLGASALVIDVGRVRLLRDQTSAAATAAALMAAQVLTRQLNGEISSSNPPSIAAVDTATAQQDAVAVYATNMAHALPNSGLGTPASVTIQPITSTYLESLPPNSPQYQALSADVGMILITVSATGTTPMYFGGAVGVPTAQIHEMASALVGLQTGVPTTNLVPLAMPATGDNQTLSLPIPPNDWTNYIARGQSYFAYRGNNGGHVPSEPAGTPSGTIPINFLGLFGAGNDGILSWGSPPYVNLGNAFAGVTGSAEWNAFTSLPVGKTAILPVGDSVHNGHGTIQVVGFITAKIDAVAGGKGTNAGVVFTIEDMSADVPTATLTGVGSASASSSATFGYHLVATPS